jgi:type IV secretory pathway component VirB8
VSFIVYMEIRKIENKYTKGKTKSTNIMLLTFVTTMANIVLFTVTQDMSHTMVMLDDMTVTMIIISSFSVFCAMFLTMHSSGIKETE